MTAKTKHFYAEFCPYGIFTLSGADRLYRFATAKERDWFVDKANRRSDNSSLRCHEVTVREVAHRYRIDKFDDECRLDFDDDAWYIDPKLVS